MIMAIILALLIGMKLGAEWVKANLKKEGNKGGASSNGTNTTQASKNTPTAQQTEVKNLDTQIKEMKAEKQTLEIDIKNLKDAKEDSKREFKEVNIETIKSRNELETLKKDIGQIEYDKKRNKNLSIGLTQGIKDFEAVVAQSGLSQVPSIQAKVQKAQTQTTAFKVKLSNDYVIQDETAQKKEIIVKNVLPNEIIQNPYTEPLPEIEELPEKYEKPTKPKPKND